MVPKRIGEMIIGICMIITEVVLYGASESIPDKSAAYPRTLLIIAFILTCAFMARNAYHIKKDGLPKETPTSEPGAMLKVIITIAAIFLYVIAMQYLGYTISTFAFTLGIMLYFGMRNIFALVLTPVAMTMFGVYVFNKLLFVILPTGVIFG